MKDNIAPNSGDDEIVDPRRDEIIALEMIEGDNDLVQFAGFALSQLQFDDVITEQSEHPLAEIFYYFQEREQQPDEINEYTEPIQPDLDIPDILNNGDEVYPAEEIKEANEVVEEEVRLQDKSTMI